MNSQSNSQDSCLVLHCNQPPSAQATTLLFSAQQFAIPNCDMCMGVIAHIWRGILQVLLFSTMTRALDVVEDYLDWRGFEHLRLDGAVSTAERGDLVRKFNAAGDLAPWV